MKPTYAQPAVLVVDDDADALSLFDAALDALGYRVHLAADGRQALVLLRSGVRPTAIITDLHMPYVDGYELVAEILADPTLAAIPITAMTAGGDPAPKGVRCVLRKPISVDQLVSLLDLPQTTTGDSPGLVGAALPVRRRQHM